MATERALLSPGEIATAYERIANFIEAPDVDDAPELSLDVTAISGHIAALTLALRGLLHCEVCANTGYVGTHQEGRFGECDCRVNAKRALGEE
jgi:hypothetical protein